MKSQKLKILMMGPSESGKTLISNIISESTNNEELGTQRPTQGVRILEFDTSVMTHSGNNIKIDIELWDCSGDHKFESCWPALRAGADGVILVCSPNTASVASRELELFYNYFVSQPKLTSKQCVVFYNNLEDQDDFDLLNLSSTFSRVSRATVNLKTGRDRLKTDFNNFVVSVVQSTHREDIN
ncbi:intraflagellar transport protein 22 homolog [Leptidea sinapis]|uniref:intraflagellar transport protein 22 homolog n=1 Tax=Leptidea sinapis TaxID=189913 RepID=UPI0021426C7F|nr:intraflagellar transport protein 22 homolog [Leptidea sinapis]